MGPSLGCRDHPLPWVHTDDRCSATRRSDAPTRRPMVVVVSALWTSADVDYPTAPGWLPMDARTRVHRRLVELGWVATRRQLLAVAPRSTVDAMLADGTLHAVARGRYALPLDQPARVTAHRLAGVAAYQTAAQHWGIPMKWPPPKPQVVVPRGRRVAQQVQAEIAISWRALPPHDVVDGWVTTPLRTVLDCAATLPFRRSPGHRRLRVRMGGRGRPGELRRAAACAAAARSAQGPPGWRRTRTTRAA